MGKFIGSIVAIVTAILLTTGAVSAETPAATKAVTESQVQIPDNIKNLDQLVDYLKAKGIVKNQADIMNYMKTNKQVIIKLTPGLIDYGYTYRMYAETSMPARDEGMIKITHNFGIKEVSQWAVPVILSNISDQTLEISKENFALVPKNTENELNVLAIQPEYILDASTGKTLGNIDFPTQREVHLYVVFHVSPITNMENVSLRVYDGKDHSDIKITNQ